MDGRPFLHALRNWVLLMITDPNPLCHRKIVVLVIGKLYQRGYPIVLRGLPAEMQEAPGRIAPGPLAAPASGLLGEATTDQPDSDGDGPPWRARRQQKPHTG